MFPRRRVKPIDELVRKRDARLSGTMRTIEPDPDNPDAPLYKYSKTSWRYKFDQEVKKVPHPRQIAENIEKTMDGAENE